MSAIGDYVHLTYSGYVRHQGHEAEPYFEGWASALNHRQTQFKNWMAQQTNKSTQQLEKELQSKLDLFKKMKNHEDLTSEEQQITQSILEDLKDEMDSKYLNVDLIAAASVSILEASGFEAGQRVGANQEKTGSQSKVITNINSQIQNLLNNTLGNIQKDIDRILSAQNLTSAVITEGISDTKKQIENFIKKMNDEKKVLDVSDQKRTVQAINDLFAELNKAVNENEAISSQVNIENIVTLLAKALSGGLVTNLYKGDISEALIAVIARQAAKTAGSALENKITEVTVTGAERGGRGYVRSNFVSQVDFNNWPNQRIKKPIGDSFVVSAEAVQNKVDVSIEMENGGVINISAKNYSPKSLQKGVTNKSASFLTLIQNENKNNLINHYLNLNAIHGGRSAIQRDATEMNNFIRQITIAKLITGYNTVIGENNQTMEEANIFAVFDSSNYKVHLYKMKDVLNGIFNSDRYKKMYIPEFFTKDNAKDISFDLRINQLLLAIDQPVHYTLKESEYVNNIK